VISRSSSDGQLTRLVTVLDDELAARLREDRLALRLRASKSSVTRGRPWVMSSPATPRCGTYACELRARLADRLGGDDATAVPMSTGRLLAKVPTVAGLADNRALRGTS